MESGEDRVPMRKRGKKFVCLKTLDRYEKFYYRFLVDGLVKFAEDQPNRLRRK
jgi:hypothetical protein